MTEETINEIQWTIHQTNPELVQPARASLSEVIDPEIGMHIIQLGLVRDISVENGVGHVKMILTTPFCPYGPQIIEQVRMVGSQVMQGGVTVEIGTELWDPSMMEEGAGGDWGLF
jgi:metal-sulfur cluster biosynthetic enzyme